MLEQSRELGKFRINFDPLKPQGQLSELGLTNLSMSPEDLLPSAIPWPAGSIPTPDPLTQAPAETDDLSRFKGYDAIVVTWTAAEGETLARLFTPGYTTSSWYQYRHRIQDYIPLVTGKDAPFNDPKFPKYYQSLGLYFPCKIGNAKVLLFKSGLHFVYDGPATPLKKLMAELYETVQPKIFITTGTGGAIGADVLLGDVVIAPKTRFDCTSEFKDADFHNGEYKAADLPSTVLHAITPALTKVNAARIPNARTTPKIWTDAESLIVTTDSFAFDDSTDFYKLQGLGRCCDMGDAMVALALQPFKDLKFYAIRNASDPQIPNPHNDMKDAGDRSRKIYAKYGGLTTAASVIATWAVISSLAK